VSTRQGEYNFPSNDFQYWWFLGIWKLLSRTYRVANSRKHCKQACGTKMVKMRNHLKQFNALQCRNIKNVLLRLPKLTIRPNEAGNEHNQALIRLIEPRPVSPSLTKPHQASPSLIKPHLALPASPNLTQSCPRSQSDGSIYAYFEEPIWIRHLCLWNRRSLFATLRT
jgi:hypothetical protein